MQETNDERAERNAETLARLERLNQRADVLSDVVAKRNLVWLLRLDRLNAMAKRERPRG